MSGTDIVRDVELKETKDLLEQEHQEVVEESVVPQKFKGKTKEDVVTSYMELEKKLGQQSNEIGELRKFTDSLLKKELDRVANTQNKKQEEKVRYDDLVSDPETSIRKAVKTDIDEVNEKIGAINTQLEFQKFATKHPDYMTVGQDEDFLSWVTRSPYRKRAFERANNHDYEAADDILSEWKEHQKANEEALAAEKAEKKERKQQQLKKGMLESNTTGADSPKKVYSRSDLIQMRVENPAKWEAEYANILLAYKEGRVK